MGYDYYGDARTLDTHIKLLRKSLGPYSSGIVTPAGGRLSFCDGARFSIKGKIFSCLAVFSVCILIVLWLLQTVFLDEFYQMIKESEVRSYSQTIADNIDSEDLTELLNRVTESGDICVHLIGADGEQLQESGKFRYCSLQEMDAQAKAVFVPEGAGKGRDKNDVF